MGVQREHPLMNRPGACHERGIVLHGRLAGDIAAHGRRRGDGKREAQADDALWIVTDK